MKTWIYLEIVWATTRVRIFIHIVLNRCSKAASGSFYVRSDQSKHLKPPKVDKSLHLYYVMCTVDFPVQLLTMHWGTTCLDECRICPIKRGYADEPTSALGNWQNF